MILELKGIYKDYQQGKMIVPVLKDVNFSMEEGEYVAIMGPSGSGKSTLMNIIGCLDQATKGTFSSHWCRCASVPSIRSRFSALPRRRCASISFSRRSGSS